MAAAAVILVGAALFLLNRRGDESPPPTPPAVQPIPRAEPPPAAAPVAVPLPPVTTPEPGWITYPDGSRFPPLNGVTQAPKMVFHPQVSPYAKVVGRERDRNGREWYVHENGVRSTTYVNSAGVSTYEVRRPMDPRPIVDDPPGTGR